MKPGNSQHNKLIRLAVCAFMAMVLLGLAAPAPGATIGGGYNHSLAVKADGTVAAWGSDPIYNIPAYNYGQCDVPPGLSGVVAVAGRYFYSLALMADGTMVAWGRNAWGCCDVPSELSGVVAVANGGAHSLALKADGIVAAWGYNIAGQCDVPAGLSGVVAVAAGDMHSLALKADGTVVAWGSNGWGQCEVPADLSGVVAIAAGVDNSLALKADGTVVAWGYNSFGECNVPADLSGVVAVASGDHHSLALKADGTVAAWGYNYDGQCDVPADLSGVVEVAAGSSHSLALKADGTVVAWGYNGWGQCEVPAATYALAPTADIAEVSGAHPGGLVALDGSGSADLDHNLPLTYSWQLVQQPAGSTATLTDPTAVNPTFTTDVMGDYKVMLVARDAMGIYSNPVWVTISTQNTAPVADAGPDQALTVLGATVNLNGLTPGRASYDPDGDTITFQWNFVSWPGSSDEPPTDAPNLSGATTSTPSFTAAVHGDYQLQLEVSDPWTSSAPSYVMVSFSNIKPMASATTTTPSVIVGQEISLDGSGSSDGNMDPLSYQWTLTSKPSASTLGTDLGVMETTSITPDVAGTYVVQLVVNDGFVNSDPDTASIQAILSPTAVIQQIQALQTQIADLERTDLKNANMRKALLNKTNAVIKTITAGNYQEARDKLKDDIFGKTDGCQGDPEGTPDKNDWIVNPQAQAALYPALLNIITQLEALF